MPQYTLQIFAYNRSCNVRLSVAAPSRVRGVTLIQTVESQAPALRVTWTPPQSVLTISQYQVEYRRSGTTSWDNATAISVSSLVTSATLTGLDAGTEYTVRVRAVSAVGHGTWSVENTGRTFCSEFNASSTSDEKSLSTSGTYIYRPTIVSFDQCLSTCWCGVALHTKCVPCAGNLLLLCILKSLFLYHTECYGYMFI